MFCQIRSFPATLRKKKMKNWNISPDSSLTTLFEQNIQMIQTESICFVFIQQLRSFYTIMFRSTIPFSLELCRVAQQSIRQKQIILRIDCTLVAHKKNVNKKCNQIDQSIRNGRKATQIHCSVSDFSFTSNIRLIGFVYSFYIDWE